MKKSEETKIIFKQFSNEMMNKEAGLKNLFRDIFFLESSGFEIGFQENKREKCKMRDLLEAVKFNLLLAEKHLLVLYF